MIEKIRPPLSIPLLQPSPPCIPQPILFSIVLAPRCPLPPPIGFSWAIPRFIKSITPVAPHGCLCTVFPWCTCPGDKAHRYFACIGSSFSSPCCHGISCMPTPMSICLSGIKGKATS